MLGEAPFELHVRLDRQAGPTGQGDDRRRQALVGEQCRVDPAGELPQVIDRRLELLGGVAESRLDLGRGRGLGRRLTSLL